jgi:hypothetical protein
MLGNDLAAGAPAREAERQKAKEEEAERLAAAWPTSALSTLLARQYELLAVDIEHGCLAGRRYRLAFGLLGEPADTVFAEGGGPPVPLYRVAIPRKRVGKASLVYRVLSPGQTTLVTRTASGRVLSLDLAGGGRAPVVGGPVTSG